MHESKNHSKKTIRHTMLATRDALSPEHVALASQRIAERVLRLPELGGDMDIFVYIGIGNEVGTRELVERLIAEGRKILAPAVRSEGALAWGVVADFEDLRPGRFGIPEPVGEVKVPDTTEGVALTPCVAFTPSGDRLGRGGGYYDRFLAHHTGPKIGLAFECQRIASLPTEAHDVRLNRIVTEAATYPA